MVEHIVRCDQTRSIPMRRPRFALAMRTLPAAVREFTAQGVAMVGK
jgi:hypothetical protein